MRTLVFGRDAYEIDPARVPLPEALMTSAARRLLGEASGDDLLDDARDSRGAGIPTVLFGPGGAGLHSIEEYVLIEDVCRCRDAW
jgi:acetylornithine deacetylase